METAPRYRREIADRKEAILSAAVELFAERGYYGTIVPDVAQLAGVGAGTLYRYFASKEALVNALYQRWKTAFGQALLARFDAEHSPRRQFHELWCALSDFTMRHPHVVAFLEMQHHAPYLDEESRKCEEAVRRPLLAFLEDLQRREIIKPLAGDLIVALVHGAFVGVAKAARSEELAWTQAMLDDAENCMWEAIRR